MQLEQWRRKQTESPGSSPSGTHSPVVFYRSHSTFFHQLSTIALYFSKVTSSFSCSFAVSPPPPLRLFYYWPHVSRLQPQTLQRSGSGITVFFFPTGGDGSLECGKKLEERPGPHVAPKNSDACNYDNDRSFPPLIPPPVWMASTVDAVCFDCLLLILAVREAKCVLNYAQFKKIV